jgi:hypothetical protein
MIKLQDIIGIIKFGLENLDTLSEGNKSVRVIDICIINEDTLCCSFYPYSSNSLDIKMEIASIMGFFNGFFRKDGFEGVGFKSYAVKGFDRNNVELIYAISSKATAELIGTGNSIDWLKSTLFQENTNDYRLAQSKRIIAEIENCLRELVKIKLCEKFGKNWWDISLDNKLGRDVKDTYFNQFGETCNDGNLLISYTFTLQLKKIISTHFTVFKPYFESLEEFDNDMVSLNKIRREEAHNRVIRENHLTELNELHEKLVSKALSELTTYQSGYLTENWRLKIKKIFLEKQYAPIYSNQEVLNEPNPQNKLEKSKKNTEHLVSYLDELITKLKSISSPVHKRATQRDLISVLEKYKDLQMDMLNGHLTLDEKEIHKTISKINDHNKEMDKFIADFLLAES